jgi:hypothetical protein
VPRRDVVRGRILLLLGFVALTILNVLFWSMTARLPSHVEPLRARLELMAVTQLGPIGFFVWSGSSAVAMWILAICGSGIAAALLAPRNPACVAVGGTGLVLWFILGWGHACFMLT